MLLKFSGKMLQRFLDKNLSYAAKFSGKMLQRFLDKNLSYAAEVFWKNASKIPR